MAARDCIGENIRRRNVARAVGVSGTAAIFLTFAMIPLAATPRAHADAEELIFQPVIDAIAQAVAWVDPSLATAIDPGFDAGTLLAPALAAAADNASVALQMSNTTPLVDISMSGGPDISVEVDTGSDGLMVPWYDVGLQNLLNLLGTQLTFATTGYGGSPANPNIEVFYLEDPNVTVDFGGGIVTAPTTVDLALFAYPSSDSNLFNWADWSLPGYLASDHADGILGVGNGEDGAVGPGTGSVLTALPGTLNDGVLINESAGYLEFGPNPLPVYASVIGGPITNQLAVSVGGGGTVPVTLATIDSGGQDGTIPSSILTGNPTVGETLSPGTQIAVYTSGGQFLYSYTTSAAHSPTVSSDTTMNTGWVPFQAYPVYLSYSPADIGTTVFDQ